MGKFFRHRAAKSRLHSMFVECEKKYCKQPEDRLLLVTKERAKHRYLVTVDAKLWHEMIHTIKESENGKCKQGVSGR